MLKQIQRPIFSRTIKKILITGGEGMIGKELAEHLHRVEPLSKVFILDLKNGDNILNIRTCEKYCEGIDEVYHLFGIKGNPKMTKEQPLKFMVPMLIGDMNMFLASIKCGVKKFLYTSSIAVENPESDKYPAWAKMTMENLINAYRIENKGKGTQFCIVRPSNVYGRFDDFDNKNAMVVTKLIGDAFRETQLKLDKKGSFQERDFINAKDVARGMHEVMKEMPLDPVNLCSGKGTQVNQIALILQKELNINLIYDDLNLVLGPDKKVMKLNWKFKPLINLKDGVKEAIEYAKLNSWRAGP